MKSLLARFSIASTLLAALLAPTAAGARVSVFINIAPPPLLVYAQPMVPGEGYIWMPGYWSWSPSDTGYYWVPGTWVLAPMAGYLWTPGYWAFEDAGYSWRRGYWGTRVGFYGGLNYGHGYSGSGYHGGRWDHGAFRYNRAVSNVDTRIVRNVYNARPVGTPGPAGVSFNGGKSGATARPTVADRRFQAARHAGPSAEQIQHERGAMTTPTQRASGPLGVPQVAATPRPSAFGLPGVEHVRSEPAGRPVPVSPRQRSPAVAPRANMAQPHAEPRAQPQMQPRVQTNPGPKPPPIQRVQREPQARSPHQAPLQRAPTSRPSERPGSS
jgi:WXXGXW repeat (2 copies)